MIELKNVVKMYGQNSVGLYNESAIIKTGEIVGILGENGSGKTTMLKAIMGLCDIQCGEILIDGRPVLEQYNKMAFITCEGSYFPNMTPYEYGNFLAEFFHSFDGEQYNRLIKFFELDPFKKIKTFSTGQKMKLEISAGFSKGAKYILMDEPFTGSDMFTRQKILKLIASSFNEENTVLISTHLIDEIENIIDRAIILRYGRIKADFYIDDIRKEGKTLADMMEQISRKYHE